MIDTTGHSIPEDTQHAVSVSLPTWAANIGYEEGAEWVVGKMQTGYPRFFVHEFIKKLSAAILKAYGHPGEDCRLYPSLRIANRSRDFILQRSTTAPIPTVRVIGLARLPPQAESPSIANFIACEVYAVMFPSSEYGVAKQFWQHSGDGISSRRAEFCLKLLEEQQLVEVGSQDAPRPKGPRRYSRAPKRSAPNSEDPSAFVEERFGRNLNFSFVGDAKMAVRRRIAGTLRSDVELDALDSTRVPGRDVEGFTENDVHLYPTGMSAIFNTHQALLSLAKEPVKSVCYGFPYIDTLKILEKFGPGCIFYGNGSKEDLDDLSSRLEKGERILALFCEFPSNPLLKSPDLKRIRTLANEYNFPVVVDETIGNFLNVHVLPFADVVVSSLTKIFSGDSNVMGGSMVLNPKSPFYGVLKQYMNTQYEDNIWGEDALFLERNSRDFVGRIKRINSNAEAVCDVLRAHSRIKQIYYPKYSETRKIYDEFRCPDGGYGGLLSVTFYSQREAVAFFDNLNTAKGPSLGTNFTLSSPYTILAHYGELEWASQFGVESDLVRISIGLEDTHALIKTFEHALEALNFSLKE
ncbi:cystathionine gamma-synthase [Ascodesmis nigricans]|uniref:cystathionine gamma-synthase n=1 Tax=Ascodesmis nigricans TaxID=341454 RepID=A0A4S2MUI8_9PEZI|nr:cystathionine gamma-synthase [Ascodesmis nigricans]